jgi:hypothetical protein
VSHQLELFLLKNNTRITGIRSCDGTLALGQLQGYLTLMLDGPMLTRRRIFGVASVICAPAIVRAESLMPIRALIVPMQSVHAGFVERLRFYCMEQV